MTLTPRSKEKNYRTEIYFDCICGVISALLSISCMIYVAIIEEIQNPGWFIVSLTFWGCYLLFSFFLIGLGIYTYYQKENFDKKKSKKDLKPPIIS